MTISASIPVEHMAVANADLEALGHGPSNFSVALRAGTAEATHAGLHAWNDDNFLADLQSLGYPGLVIRNEPGQQVNFEAHVQQQALEWSDPSNWFENPVMTGDQRTYNGKTWESLMDYNVWAPPIGWREVVASGYPAWVQPTGAHDAYNTGDRVNFEGGVYESTIDANTWSPTGYPAGWQYIEPA